MAEHVAGAGTVVVEADWLGEPSLWYWECFRCRCSFGPLFDNQEAAAAGAAEHAREDHAETKGSVGG